MIGKNVSHYKIISKLGEGGMGEVWEAHDSRLDRTVAIKLIPKYLSADPAARTRFVHEAKAASSIEHANICTIHEIDETPEGETFIVMPRYQGELLSNRIARGRLPLEEALHIVEDLAGALAEAHDQDIVHRDVKPANIIIDPHDRPILLDFGLAKLTEHTKVTKTGTTVGTLAYMAPEQAAGGDVDGRADLFSLGVVLYELVSGVRPFRGEHDAAVLYSIAHEAAEPLASHDPSLPDALQTIVDRSLAKEPESRYANLHELRAAITELRRGLQTASVTQTRDVRSNRNRLLLPLVAAVIVLAAIAIWKFVPNRSVVTAAEQAVAVVEFNDLTGAGDPNRAIGMAGLIHVGMVENAPCRVVSPSYLQDIRRRLFGAERGPIEEGQALEVARKSGASVLLSGQMGELDGEPYVVWQLVDTENGESLMAKRAEGAQLSALADAVLEGVLPALAARCGADISAPIQSVTDLTTAHPRAYQYFVAGRLARERRELDKAIDLFENAVVLDTTFALAYYDLAKAHITRLVYGPARENTEHAWRWRSRLSIQDRMRLEAWRDQLNYHVVEAINVYRELHTRWPDDKEILKELSYQLLYWWFHSECLDVSRGAMALYPDEATFVQHHEFMLACLDRPEEALEVARALVKRFPENPNHWDDLGLRFVGAGLPDSAEVAFKSALAIEPGFIASQGGLAALAYYRGDLKSAIDNLGKHARRTDLSPDARYRVLVGTGAPVGGSFVCYEAGQYKLALELFDEAGLTRNDPVDRHYHQRYRCRLLLRVGRAEEVLRWTDMVANELAAGVGEMGEPQLAGIARWSVVELRAFALVAMDSLVAAREAVSALMGTASEFGNDIRIKALFLSAQIALREGDATAALAALDERRQEGVGLGRPNIEHHEARAAAYRLSGRLEEAAAVHKKLLRVYGGHALSHYQLGLIYEEMNRPGDAAREYRRFLDMWANADEDLPQLADARERLSALVSKIPQASISCE